MARTRKNRWSYSAGERGRNRVRAFEHESGVLMLEFQDGGRRARMSLGHRDRTQAKRAADQAAARLAMAEDVRPEEPGGKRELTLGELLDIYGREATPDKGSRSQYHDRKASRMFARYFGRTRVVTTLNLRDWDRFIRDRKAGRVGPGDPPWSPVRDRTVEYDLRFLLAAFNWATMAGDGRGGVLLDRNPLKGFKVPREKNPRRVVVSQEEYEALLSVSWEVDWRFHVALVLAHETGHRIGAIRQLRWSDVDLDEGWILWRAETEKTGHQHATPMTDAARRALLEAREHNPGIGNSPVLPAPKDPGKPMARYLARDWWRKAEKRAGLEFKAGRGWHSLRRKFASDLKGVPLKTLCELGGWKTHVTVLMCYQTVNESEMREALAMRRSGT